MKKNHCVLNDISFIKSFELEGNIYLYFQLRSKSKMNLRKSSGVVSWGGDQ